MEITATVKPADRGEWRDWLAGNHATESFIWILFDKRDEVPTVTYLDAVEEGICFGWIDGIAKRKNEFETAQRFSPRRPKGNWTELNKERARRLIALGLMTDAGRSTLPDLDLPFEAPERLLNDLQADAEAWSTFCEMPELYRRVRLDNLASVMRTNEAEYTARIDRFLKRTKLGKMVGNWNDGGRLPHCAHDS